MSLLTDPTGDAVQQPQAPAPVQPQINVHQQPLTFSKDMNSEQLAVWLRNHPSLTGTNYEEDIRKLRSTYIASCITQYSEKFFYYRC